MDTLLQWQPNTGRIVWRYKNLVKHTGVLAGNNQCGQPMVIHNHPANGRASLVTLEEFAQGKQVRYDDRPCSFPQRIVWQRAIDAVNRRVPYQLLTSNCQHLTSGACHGQQQSEDLQQIFKTLAVGATVLLCFMALGAVAKNAR